MTGWVILTSLHVALTTIAIVTGVRVLAGMIFGQATSEVVPVYFSTTIVVCLTSSQLPIQAPVTSVMIALTCLLSVLAAIHSRYFGLMHGAYRTVYAAATSISVITLGTGAILQGMAALPELGSAMGLLTRKAAVLILIAVAGGATALAVRGVWRPGSREICAGPIH